MLPDLDLVNVSRLQFAATAMYHFLFVPLTLGLSWILVICESVYVMTGRQIYRDMTRFWGLLFGINFVMGVTTGLTLEFQFGTNWAYYAHYVGDVFGVPLAIEGLMAFILESTFVGLFFFGWQRLGKVEHLMVTFLVALGSNLSALWILIANGWMQNPVGAEFNYETMRMELTSMSAVLLQSGRAGEIRAHGGRRLRHRLHVRARRVFVLPAEGARRRVRAAVVCGCRRIRPCLHAVGDRAWGRIRLHDRRDAEGEAGRHRSRMGDAEGPGVVHGIRVPQRRDAAHRPRDPHSVAARPDRHAFGHRGSHRHQGAEAESSGAHRKRHDRLCAAPEAAGRRQDRSNARAVREAQERSGLRPAAQEIHGERRRCHAGAETGRGR